MLGWLKCGLNNSKIYSIQAYYMAEGHGYGSDKMIFYFQGGATIEGEVYDDLVHSAYLRSKTHLGSSNFYKPQAQFSGLLSRDPLKNPHFHNWNVIYVKYCDGTAHQGYKQDPIEYMGTKLYFQGERNTLEIIKQIDFSQINLLMVSGFSAGGYAVYNWIQSFKSLVPGVKLLGVPDSGLYLDWPNIRGVYLAWQEEQIAFIEQNRNDLIDTIQGKMKEEGWGTWTISCINHGYLEFDRFNSEEYKVNGLKLSDALWNWANGEKSISIDQVKWPNNQGCAFMKQNRQRPQQTIQNLKTQKQGEL